MAKKVDGTPEHMEICKQYCGPCSTFKPNNLNEVELHALFCARGASKKLRDQIEDRGCNCFGRAVFRIYELEGGWVVSTVQRARNRLLSHVT